VTRRPKKTKAVVFDLDGTLIDSLPLVLRAFTHALEPFGSQPSMDLFARLGGPPHRIFADLIGDERHVPAAINRLHAFSRDHNHLIRPFDGVAVVLEKLRTRDVTLAVWTGRDRESTEWLLREHALENYFATVVCGDDLPTHKPNPDGLREILRRLNMAPQEAMMVGDADVDVQGAAACSVETLLISHAREVESDVRTKAWRVVVSPFEAYEVVLARTGA
jgi:pyrophosphatase PpaX